jgi:1-aminocyclopropane-1-carboxylate deaminase/D-cysteine desulfhydrase-like pyridoxal-dependent ACC family enzyme
MDYLMKQSFNYPLSIDSLSLPELTERNVSAGVLRLDKLHPVISGNKWFKLKNHLQAAMKKSSQQFITFGGAWSNHIVAAAYAAQQTGLRAIGIIRGERPAVLSDTLRAAADYGMQLEFISRNAYKQKDDPVFLEQLRMRWPGAYIIPEGGAGVLGIKGSEDILETVDKSSYSHILCAIGTGTMYLGLANAMAPGQILIGLPVLKGMNDLSAISREGLHSPEKVPYCRIVPDYHFGGYARSTPELFDFMNRFYQATGIPSDFVYTGKLFYGMMDMLCKGFFPKGARLLLIHSGGLQGNNSLAPGVLDF